jgi:hypothetical protein
MRLMIEDVCLVVPPSCILLEFQAFSIMALVRFVCFHRLHMI